MGRAQRARRVGEAQPIHVGQAFDAPSQARLDHGLRLAYKPSSLNTDHSWAPIREFSADKRRPRFPWEAGAALAVAIGLLGWWLVPRYLEMKRATQEKIIQGHVFAYLTGADQFFRQHPERLFVRQDELVGPNRMLPQAVMPEAGEVYAALFPIRRDHPELAVTTVDGRWVIWFMYESTDGQPQRGVVTVRADGEMLGGSEEIKTYRQILEREKSDGVHGKLFPDGSRFETTTRGGVPHGAFKAYYPDGKPWGEANYENGRVTGPAWNYPRQGARFDELSPPDLSSPLKTVP
jgi:hypothetical protein